MSFSEHGTSIAAPTPCKTRAAMRLGKSAATPQIVEASVNTIRPAR